MKKNGVTVKSDKNPPEKMSIEEKLKLLNAADKAYIRGYIDRALAEQKRKSRKKSGEKTEG